MCEPLSVGVHACRRGDVCPGKSVAILGAGPIGKDSEELENLEFWKACFPAPLFGPALPWNHHGVAGFESWFVQDSHPSLSVDVDELTAQNTAFLSLLLFSRTAFQNVLQDSKYELQKCVYTFRQILFESYNYFLWHQCMSTRTVYFRHLPVTIWSQARELVACRPCSIDGCKSIWSWFCSYHRH